MSKSNFLDFLVDETLQPHFPTSQHCDLERKLHDYGISYIKGEFIPQIQMLRFHTAIGLMDIPINWSYFTLDHGKDYTWLNESNDEEGLLFILKGQWKKSIKSLLITQAAGHCYIVALQESEEFYLQDLTNLQEMLVKSA